MRLNVLAVLFPDKSLNVLSQAIPASIALQQARQERDRWNRSEPKAAKVVHVRVEVLEEVE